MGESESESAVRSIAVSAMGGGGCGGGKGKGEADPDVGRETASADSCSGMAGIGGMGGIVVVVDGVGASVGMVGVATPVVVAEGSGVETEVEVGVVAGWGGVESPEFESRTGACTCVDAEAGGASPADVLSIVVARATFVENSIVVWVDAEMLLSRREWMLRSPARPPELPPDCYKIRLQLSVINLRTLP